MCNLQSSSNSMTNSTFNTDIFESAIDFHGYDVFLESVIRCPCSNKATGQTLSSCMNCGSTGYVFFNRRKTKLLLQSMNSTTQFKEWSEENRGTVSISAKNSDRLTFMEKITIEKGSSIFNEVVYPSYTKNNKSYSFLVYEPIKIIDIFAFESVDKPLLRLSEEDYSFKRNILELNYDLKDFGISIKYEHYPQYCVIDITRDLMIVKNKNDFDCNNVNEVIRNMPVHAVGRRLHYILNTPIFEGDSLLDNSYGQFK